MALHAAASRGDAAELELLLIELPDVDARDERGNTPLHVAAACASPVSVAALLAAGAAVGARNASGEMPLLSHVKAAPAPPTPSDPSVASLLLSAGADVNATDDAGYSPLIAALFEGKETLVERLLAPDASPNLDAQFLGMPLMDLARVTPLRHMLHAHPASPVGRLSGVFAAAAAQQASGAAAGAQPGAHPRGPLLVRTAVLAAAEPGGPPRAVQLGSAELPHVTRRLIPDTADVPFAPERPALPEPDDVAQDLSPLLARVTLGGGEEGGAAASEEQQVVSRDEAAASVLVETRALASLLLTPPTAWQPPAPGSPFCLSADDIVHMCDRLYALLRLERTVLRLRAPVKIFGDTHGQYCDLMRLFAAFGSPSITGDIFATDYLFVGDFVDRGRHQLETICLLMALKLAHPAQVHLLRGNHEILEVNTYSHDFLKHCRQRLGSEDGKRVHAALNDMFELLPLAALLETDGPSPTRVFCVHGGVGRLQRVEELDAVTRPLSLSADVACLAGAPLRARLLADDALWSDPAGADGDAELEAAGGAEDNVRGAGARFAPSVVRAFCARNDVAAVVRAHQVPPDGVELFAGGLGVTVFSCADYPETAGDAEREGNLAGLLWMGRDGRLYARLLPPQPRA